MIRYAGRGGSIAQPSRVRNFGGSAGEASRLFETLQLTTFTDEEIKKAFDSYDTNGDGILQREEVRAWVSRSSYHIFLNWFIIELIDFGCCQTLGMVPELKRRYLIIEGTNPCISCNKQLELQLLSQRVLLVYVLKNCLAYSFNIHPSQKMHPHAHEKHMSEGW